MLPIAMKHLESSLSTLCSKLESSSTSPFSDALSQSLTVKLQQSFMCIAIVRMAIARILSSTVIMLWLFVHHSEVAGLLLPDVPYYTKALMKCDAMLCASFGKTHISYHLLFRTVVSHDS